MTETDYVPPDDSYTNADQPVLWEEPEDDVAGDDFSPLGELWLDEGDGHCQRDAGGHEEEGGKYPQGFGRHDEASG